MKDDETPSPSPSPSPSRSAAAASSTASGAGSSPFVDDPGHFDPDAPAAEPAPAAGAQIYGLPPALPEWEEASVRNVLNAKGELVHTLIAVDKESDEWRYTQSDLNAIAPPLTRILNRYDATRAAAGTADELALIIGLSGYVGRSIRVRRESAADLATAEPEPLSGVRTQPIPTPQDAPPVASSPVGDMAPPTATT